MAAPTSINNLKRLLFALVCFLQISLAAQSPQGFNYQAVARDASGQVLVNQQLSVRFTITNQPGTLTYQEEHSTTTNSFGLINLVVGTGSSTAISNTTFPAIPWGSNSPYSMQVEINVQSSWVNMGSTVLWSVP